MKGHFDAGTAALEQAKQLRAQIDKMPKDQQAAAQGQLQDTAGKAVSELQQALEGTADTDPNRHIVLARLGDAYETDAKYTEAADAYTQGRGPQARSWLLQQPRQLPGSNRQGGRRPGPPTKRPLNSTPPIPRCTGATSRSACTTPGRIKESVDPLRKATEADPKNAQAWYLLGAALVNTMEFKQDGDKLVPVLQPGTIEAYQKSHRSRSQRPLCGAGQARPGRAAGDGRGHRHQGESARALNAPPKKK